MGLLSHREVAVAAVAEQVVVARAAQVRGPVVLQAQQAEQVRTPRPEEPTKVRVPEASVREEARPIRGVTTQMTQLTSGRRIRRIGRARTASLSQPYLGEGRPVYAQRFSSRGGRRDADL
jgi:hypothetical protein